MITLKNIITENKPITAEIIDKTNIPPNLLYLDDETGNYFLDWFKENEIRKYLITGDYCFIFGPFVNEIEPKNKKIALISPLKERYKRINKDYYAVIKTDETFITKFKEIFVNVNEIRLSQLFVRSNYFTLINKGFEINNLFKELKRIQEYYDINMSFNILNMEVFYAIFETFNIIRFQNKLIYKDFKNTINKMILID